VSPPKLRDSVILIESLFFCLNMLRDSNLPLQFSPRNTLEGQGFAWRNTAMRMVKLQPETMTP
jgi:hypothetical protein